MRRRPNDTNQSKDTRVFSTAWGESDTSYTESDSTIDLSKYAAPAIPVGNAHARATRHSPSPHSAYYEPSENLTNSERDPFSHSLYDGRPTPAKQNSSYDDMPSPVRKSRLGTTIQGIASDTLAQQYTPVQETPPGLTQTFNAPQTQNVAPQNFAPQTQQSPLQTQTPAQTPAPQVHTQPVPAPAPRTQPAPQAYEPVTAPTPAPEQNEQEIQLSDFEEEFHAQTGTNSSVVDDVIDLTKEPTYELPAQPQAWAAPSLFTSPQTQSVPEIVYHTNDEFFGSQYTNESDSDRLYKDPREPRETIQIDVDFLKRIFSKLTLNKIIIIAVALALFVGAYFVMKPDSPAPKNLPTNPSLSVQDPAGKTVVSNELDSSVPENNAPAEGLSPAPTVTVAPSGDAGPIVEYDEDGNVVYNRPNQNFNG